MSAKPRILCAHNSNDAEDLPGQLRDQFEVVEVENFFEALSSLAREPFDGLYFPARNLPEASRLGRALEHERLIDEMPDGVAVLDVENTIIWANARFREWVELPDVEGTGFYTALANPEILGPDFCPFHTALATGQPSYSTLRVNENRYFQTHAAPVNHQGVVEHLIVTVRDVTDEMLQQQKLAAIHKAGIELADLTPDEIFNMEVGERIELLKSNILHYTQHLLRFDVVEIRLLDAKSGKLMPLLAVGIDEEAAGRALFARPSTMASPVSWPLRAKAISAKIRPKIRSTFLAFKEPRVPSPYP